MENIEYKLMPTTLLLVIKENKILLAAKKRGFGLGKYNGVGGKLEEGESVEEAMIRETFEEISIVPTEYKLRAVIDFKEFYKGMPVIEKTHIFVATDYTGQPTETEEMKPFWFDLDKIPYHNMFPDDSFWLPQLIEGKNIIGYFEFDKDFNKLAHELKVATEQELNDFSFKGE